MTKNMLRARFALSRVLPFGDLLRPAEERLKERGPVDGTEHLRMRKRVFGERVFPPRREYKIDFTRFHDFMRSFMFIRITVAPISLDLFPSCRSSGRVSTRRCSGLGRDSFLSRRSLSRLIIPLA